MTLGRTAIAVEFALAVAIIVYAGFHDIRIVFVGAPPGLPVHLDGTCESADSESPCRVTVTELSPARFRVAASAPATMLTIAFDAPVVPGAPAAPGEIVRAHHLLVSTPSPVRLEWRRSSHDAAAIEPVELPGGLARTVIPVPVHGPIAAIALTPAAPAPIVVAELGVFEDNRGLLSDERPLFRYIPPQRYHTTLVPRAVMRLCFFTMLAALFVPAALLRKLNPFALTAVCFSLCLIDLAAIYSPYTARDLHAFYASGPLQEIAGSNLNGALWEATRLVHGQGFTVADGLVSWAKMPGYGLFAALAGVLFGDRTFVDLAVSTVLLQVLFYSAALGFFVWAAGRLWRPAVVWTVGLLIAMLPKQLGYTQVDSIIAPLALMILGALCLRLAARDDDRPVARIDLVVHLMFALWFLMRPDVLPAWAIVSLILHARDPRRLLVPLALAAAIGIGWAGYKMRYTGEFVPTTSTTGASLLCGLWEVPSRFPWVCSDESYFAWVSAHTPFEQKSQAASNVVVREVVRFWLTYPGHFVFMVYNKMMRCLGGDLWSGMPTDLQQSVFQIVGRGPLILLFLTTIALAVAAGYRRSRTLLLAWPLFLNAPVFWIMQTSEGRYYGAVGVALLVAAVPLLFDPDFYRALLERHRATLVVLVSMAVLATGAWPLHDWLLRNDRLHYWTPFLDPSASSFGVVK